MTARERLIDLIINAKRTDPETGSFTEWLADFLLGYGVIVPGDDRPPAAFLRDLVEADRAGRCVVLPFDIGDSVFDDGLGKINEWEVTGFSIGECHFDSNVCGDLYDGKLVVHTKGKSLVGVKLDFPEYAIGSYVFTDHDATEAALEKMREAQA